MASTIPSPSQISSLPPPSSHRLPTVSVAQALFDLESSRSRCISSGLRELDAALQGREIGVLEGGNAGGGVSRGKVTEIWGPPGVGKTALGMQLAASSLHAGEGVIWVDGSHPISGHRFSQILSSFEPTTSSINRPEPTSVAALMENLTHFSTPTLAHLIALLSYQTTNYEDSNTSLIIIDSFSTLISTAFPRTVGSASIPSKARASNHTSRKFPMLQHVVNLLQKLAATCNLAVVVLSQCVTKMRPGAGAVLVPAVSTAAWEQGLGSRVVLFRDWGWDDEEGNKITDVRLAEVVKAEGVPVAQGRRRLFGFSIGNTGLRHLALPTGRPNRGAPRLEHAADPASAPAVPQKRKLSAAELEIPDSEGEDDEDYGWAEEDEEDMPPMPPQWQGSEDILVPGQGELESEGGEDEDGEEEEEEAGNGLHAKEGKGIPGPDARDATVERGLGVEVGDSEDEGF